MALQMQRLWRRLVDFVMPPISAEDPEIRFRLSVLRAQAQVTSLSIILPLIVWALDIAGQPSPTYLPVIAAISFVLATTTLWMLRRRIHRAAYWLVPLAFFISDVVLPFGLTVELLYPTLVLMLYADVLLSPRAVAAVHAVHLAIIGGFIAFTDTYTLLPPNGNVNTTHYFSTYLILYLVAFLYVRTFRNHLVSVTHALAERSRDLAHLNAHLEDELFARTEQLAEHQEELSRRRRAEALTIVTSGIAHDINNLLAVIQVNADLLEAKLPPEILHADSEQAKILARVRRAIRRGESLTERMLGVVRQEPLSLEPIPCRDMLDAVVDMLRPSLPAHIRVVLEGDLEGAVVSGDRAQLEQVLLNLLVNSIHAIADEPGEIRVSVSAQPHDRVTIQVLDTGSGVPPALLHRVFEPFFTTKPPGLGTGLGLAQVRRVVAEHGGTVALRSEHGAWTSITLDLAAWTQARPPAPRPISAPVASASSSPTAASASPKPPSILLAEDEDDIAEVIVAALPAARIHRVRDGKAAVAFIESLPHPLDLLIVDLTLPAGTGRAVFDAARARWPGLPVLVATGHVDSEDLQEILAQPDTACLSKPFSLRDLRGTVARMLGRSGPHRMVDPRPAADDTPG